MQKIFATAILLIFPAMAMAQGYGNGRANSWEFSIGGIYQQGDSSNGENGSSLKVDSEIGLGFNIAYNINDHLSVGGDFDFIKPDYVAVLVDENDPDVTTTIDHRFSQFNGRLKATFNLTKGPFVPYVEIGAGWTYIDSNVADGPPITGCWWHPWWGYICENFYSTFSETSTTYGGAVGFRYEMVGNSFLKLSYSLWQLDTGTESADPQLEAARLEWGWRF